MLKNIKGLAKYDPSQNSSNMIKSIGHLLKDNNIEIGFYKKSNTITAYITDDHNDVIWEYTGDVIDLMRVLDLGNVKGFISKRKKNILIKVANFFNANHVCLHTIHVCDTNSPNAIGVFSTDVSGMLYYYNALSIGPAATFDKTNTLFNEQSIENYNNTDIRSRKDLIFTNEKRNIIISNIKLGTTIGLITVAAIIVMQLLLNLILELL